MTLKRFLRITAIFAAVACLVSAAAPAFAAELYEKQAAPANEESAFSGSAVDQEDAVAPELEDETTPASETDEKPDEIPASKKTESQEPEKENTSDKPQAVSKDTEQEESKEIVPDTATLPESQPESEHTEKTELQPEPEPAAEPDPVSSGLNDLSDEEILKAGEKLLKDAIAKADKEGTDLDIIFTGFDLDLYLRYQEVKARLASRPKLRGLLKAASADAEIAHIYALNSGDTLRMVNGKTEANPSSHAISTHVHYDRDTKNAVYCANINRHFVDSTSYDVAGQWEGSEMYSALSYVFDNGVKKLNGLAAKKYTTGTSNRDWYATQMVIWEILHHYGIKDAKGGDAGLDIATTSAVSGYENVYSMMKKLYDDALYFASKQANGNSEDPYYVLENPDYKLILQGKTDTIFFITSAEEPIYTLDVKGASMASGATVHLYKKNYTGAQQWVLEESEEAGYYYFKNAHSNKYLEVENDGTANATNIQQNEKTGKDGQKWKMLIESDGTVEFAPKLAPNKRIDIKSAVFVNGTNVQLYASNGTKAQKFRCEPMDVQAKNISSDGKYVQTDWIDVEAKGDLADRTFSLENAPKGSSVVYEKANDPLSRVAVRVPVSAIPADGKCEFLLKVNATFNQPMISYLAINDATTQELLVAGNSVPVEVSDQLSVYTIPAFGGLKITKRDADTKDTVPQGDASLEGVEIEIVNKTGGSVVANGKEYADGAVVKTIKTDKNGYAETGARELQSGTYLLREKNAPTGYLKEGVTERTAEITVREDGSLTDMTSAANALSDKVIRGGVRIKKRDADRKNDLPQGNGTLANAEYSIVNKSANPVVVNGTSYANGKVVMVIKTNSNGVAETPADALPYGSYEIYESKESAGYRVSSTWKQPFQIRENGKIVDLTGKPCDEPGIRGGVKIRKNDADLKKAQAQGDATITKAAFAITNKSKEAVFVDGKLYASGEVVKSIVTDDKGAAQTAADALPYGTYEIAETDPSTGYLVNNSWKQTFEIKENGKIVDLTGSPCEEPVIRGGVRIKKKDSDYKDDDSQGDAALKNAEFTITNKSKASVVVNGKEYAVNEDVIVIKTNDQGVAETAADTLPYGTYEIRETRPSEGYLLNEEWKQTFEIRENGKIEELTKEPCDEQVIHGGVSIEKRDLELDKNEALGGASLAGIEFTIINASPLRVWVDGESYEPDAVITTIVTDEEGNASLPENCLPYGTYTIRETKTNDCYLLTDGKPRTFEIRKDNEIVTVDTSEEELNFCNQVVRNDFHFNKIADGSNARMGKTAFVITMLKTGEQHVIVTDRNGVYNSKSKVNPHSQNTNGNDFVLEKYAGEEDIIPSEELDYKVGLWFGLGQKGSEAEVQDGLGALPYGDYRLQELRCESNIGYKLLDIRFYVETDQTVEPVIDLGTLTDDEEEKPEIGTTAVAKDSEAHETQAGKETTIVDTVIYKNLKPDVEYTMHGTLMVVPEAGKEAQPLLANGEPVKAEKTFTPEKADGAVETTFTFDSTALAGTKTVVFEEVRGGNLVIAEHADPEDEDQQISIIEIGTTAADEETGTHTTEPEKKDIFIDTVRYTGLTPGKKYEVRGTLMDKETGEEILVKGRKVSAKETFVPDTADGTVEIEFKVDTRELTGKTIVVFEDLYRDGRKIASHADIEDADQSITVIEIGTTAVDKTTGTHESEASENAIFVDTVRYKGLTKGKKYTVKGVLMDTDTGKELLIDGKTVTAEAEFTASEADGTVTLEYSLNTKDLAGKKVVVFEDLYQDGKKIASHADIKDEEQSINIIEIGTHAKDKASGTQEAEPEAKTTIVDTVEYTGLTKGQMYVVKGILMNKETGEPVKIDNEPVIADKEFKAKKSDGSIELEFVFDGYVLKGQSIVVFEDLIHDGIKVASHADLADKDQTVTIKTPEPTPTPDNPTPTPKSPTPTPSTPKTPSTPTTTPEPEKQLIKAKPVKTGDPSMPLLWVLLMVAAGGAGVIVAKKRK